jgi:hypothetical protein
MKKFLAYTTAILFVGVLTLSILAFAGDDPKKQKTEATTTEQSDKNKDAVTGTAEKKACCEEAGKTASGDCAKKSECEHHSESTADAK